MELFVFLVTAAVALLGALVMVFSKNAVHSALFALLNFGSISILYLLLRAPFLFTVQLIVYGGAIIVLFLFVVMLLGAERVEDDVETITQWQRPLAFLLGAVLLIEALYIFLRIDHVPQVGGANSETFAEPERIAEALFTTYLLPFEITGFMLLAAVVGVVVLHQHGRRTEKS